MPPRKFRLGGAPIDGVLIVAGDAGESRDVRAFREERDVLVGAAPEHIVDGGVETRVEVVAPTDGRLAADGAAVGEEAEEIGTIGPACFAIATGRSTGLCGQLALRAEQSAVLVRAVDQRNLEVITGVACEVRKRVEIEATRAPAG